MDLGDTGGEEEALFEDGKFVEAFEVDAAAGEEGDVVTLGGVASVLGCVKVFGPVGEAAEAEDCCVTPGRVWELTWKTGVKRKRSANPSLANVLKPG